MTTILYVCVHNAGRSQMAEAFTNYLAVKHGYPVRGVSAGTVAGSVVNPLAIEAMREIGIDMSGQQPKQLTQEMADAADQIVTMGCGVDAQACPAHFLLTADWGLADPAGQSLERVRAVRDEIAHRVAVTLNAFDGGE